MSFIHWHWLGWNVQTLLAACCCYLPCAWRQQGCWQQPLRLDSIPSCMSYTWGQHKSLRHWVVRVYVANLVTDIWGKFGMWSIHPPMTILAPLLNLVSWGTFSCKLPVGLKQVGKRYGCLLPLSFLLFFGVPTVWLLVLRLFYRLRAGIWFRLLFCGAELVLLFAIGAVEP